MKQHDQHDIDSADDDLTRIMRQKEELTDLLDAMQKLDGVADFTYNAACMEEAFDESFTAEWYRLAEVSGSVEWVGGIPKCEVLRAKLLRQRKEARERRNLSAKETYQPLPNKAMTDFRVRPDGL